MAAPPNVRIHINFSGSTWTEVTSYWQSNYALSYTGGRSDTDSYVQPGRLNNLVLDNADGRFTMGYSSGAYYPNVRSGKKVRVQIQNPVSSAWVDRFVGRIDSWAIKWGKTGNECLIVISATDMLGDAARAYDPSGYLPDYYALLNDLTTYWSLAGFNLVPEVGSGTWTASNTVAPPIEAGPNGDPRPIPHFPNSARTVGLYQTFTGTYFRFGFAFKSSVITPTGGTRITNQSFFGFSNSLGALLLEVDTTGHLLLSQYGTDIYQPPSQQQTGDVNICDGQWRYFVVGTDTASGSTSTVYVHYWTPGNAAVSSVSMSMSGWGWGQSGTKNIFCGYFDAIMGHVTRWDIDSTAAGDTVTLGKRLRGDIADTMANVLARQCDLLGLTDAMSGTARTAMGQTPAPPSNAMQVFQYMMDTEGGIIWANRSGTITFESRGKFTSNTTTLTVTAYEVAEDTYVSADGVDLINHATVENKDVDWNTSVSTSLNQGSIDIVGYKHKSMTTYSSTASWASTRSSELIVTSESLRISELTIDVMQMVASQQEDVLDTSLWNRISVSSLPSVGGFPSSQALRVEGWTETVGIDVWTIKYSTSQP